MRTGVLYRKSIVGQLMSGHQRISRVAELKVMYGHVIAIMDHEICSARLAKRLISC
jgi:hypothetical protein